MLEIRDVAAQKATILINILYFDLQAALRVDPNLRCEINPTGDAGSAYRRVWYHL
jgi:hypothetical protein